jgi:hypothetical protein
LVAPLFLATAGKTSEHLFFLFEREFFNRLEYLCITVATVMRTSDTSTTGHIAFHKRIGGALALL